VPQRSTGDADGRSPIAAVPERKIEPLSVKVTCPPKLIDMGGSMLIAMAADSPPKYAA
jgi:hypothetical protein